MSSNKELMSRVEDEWPVGKTEDGDIVARNESNLDTTEPSFRENQKDAVASVVKGFEDAGKDVMLLDAPTGSGKSLINYTIAKLVSDVQRGHNSKSQMMEIKTAGNQGSNIPEPLNSGAFITTPLNSLVDQIDSDEFISNEVITLKGRNNYQCIHPEDSGTPVNEAICQRESDFDCDYKFSCPYYGRKYEALQHPTVVTNLSYLMAEGMIPGAVQGTFGNRDILVLDECQKLEDFAMNFISFTISARTVPDEVWSNIDIPTEYNTEWADDKGDIEENWDYIRKWLKQEVLHAAGEMKSYLERQPMMSEQQTKDLEKIQQFEMRVENFLEDQKSNDWISQIDVSINKNSSNDIKFVFKPVEIGRFLKSMLWNRADKILLSSATIPKGDWLNEIGLGDMDVGKKTIPSTFPVENRPIIVDQAVGKMTYGERDKNAWPMAQKIKKIAEFHDGKGMVHCRSYNIAKLLRQAFYNHGERKWFNENVMMQDSSDREGSLEEWQRSDKQVFFSVAMDEGVDLEGDDCRWQVLAKTLYKSMKDKRVDFRVQTRNEWDWYNRHAAIQIQQAYGRAVRSPEDWAVFYILDSSAVGLIDRNEHLFEEWFLDAIES